MIVKTPFLTLVFTISSTLFLVGTSHAALYRCTGSDGKVVYQEIPCASTATEKALQVAPPAPKLMTWIQISEDEAKESGIAGRYVALVKSKLKDPASAQFGEVRFLKSDKGTYGVCGEVNAKNGFGGYTGASGFIVTDTTAYLDSNDELWGSLYKAIAKNMCKK